MLAYALGRLAPYSRIRLLRKLSVPRERGTFCTRRWLAGQNSNFGFGDRALSQDAETGRVARLRRPGLRVHKGRGVPMLASFQ